jgi:hypothetical protein
MISDQQKLGSLKRESPQGSICGQFAKLNQMGELSNGKDSIKRQ